MPHDWLVTGAAGFLGSHVVEQLLQRGERVLGVDDLSWGHARFVRGIKDKRFSFVKADIRDPRAMEAAFKKAKPRRVIHLAALHFIPAAMKDPPLAVSINVLGTQCVLSAALAQKSVEAFWFASTGDVYPPSEQPHRETDAPAPFNIYGLSKLQGEQLVELASRSRPDIRFVVGRLFNLVGARETNPHILPEILSQLEKTKGKKLKLGNIWPKRDLVPVAEAARAAIESLEKAPVGVTKANFATGRAQSMEELIRQIEKILGHPIAVETDPAKVRAVERKHLQADVSRLRELIGWTPEPGMEPVLRELLGKR